MWGDYDGTGVGEREGVVEKQRELCCPSFGLQHRFSGCYKEGKCWARCGHTGAGIPEA